MFSCVKKNVVERNRYKVQAVPAEMQTRNGLYVADVDKTYNVRMAKTRSSNGRMHGDYPLVHLTITEQKFSNLRRKTRCIMELIETTEMLDFIIMIHLFCLLDVCGHHRW